MWRSSLTVGTSEVVHGRPFSTNLFTFLSTFIEASDDSSIRCNGSRFVDVDVGLGSWIYISRPRAGDGFISIPQHAFGGSGVDVGRGD
jgi:hypothetical protein